MAHTFDDYFQLELHLWKVTGLSKVPIDNAIEWKKEAELVLEKKSKLSANMRAEVVGIYKSALEKFQEDSEKESEEDTHYSRLTATLKRISKITEMVTSGKYARH